MKIPPFLTTARELGRCISLRLQEACGGNNRKPFKHFSLPLFIALERRSQFHFGQDFHLPITAFQRTKEVFEKLKYKKIVYARKAQRTHSQSSDVAHRLLPFTAI